MKSRWNVHALMFFEALIGFTAGALVLPDVWFGTLPYMTLLFIARTAATGIAVTCLYFLIENSIGWYKSRHKRIAPVPPEESWDRRDY